MSGTCVCGHHALRHSMGRICLERSCDCAASRPMTPAVPDPTVEALRDEIARVIPAAMTGLPRPTIYVEAADAVIALLAARAAAPDALRVKVEALAYGEAASAVLNGVVGTTPDAYGGVTKDEALDYAAELLNDLRALLEDGAQ